MKKCSRLSSAAAVIGALRVNNTKILNKLVLEFGDLYKDHRGPDRMAVIY